MVGDTDAVDTLNPFNGFTGQDYEVYGLIYDNLMDYGQLNYAGPPGSPPRGRTPKTG